MLEGNYWKRRIEVVMREYHKWRIYYKKRVSGSAHAAPCPVAVPAAGWNSVPWNLEPWQGDAVWPPELSLPGGDIGCLLLPAPKVHTGWSDLQSKEGESAEKGCQEGERGAPFGPLHWAEGQRKALGNKPIGMGC